MPRKDTPCSECGKMCWASVGTPSWTPPAKHVCRDCRRAQPRPRIDGRAARNCIDCGEPAFGQRCLTCHKIKSGWVPGRTKSEKRRQATARRVARERLAPGLTRDERYALRDKWIRQGRTCYYCPAKADTLDHVVPLARGGTNYEGNLVPCCNDCNWKKSDNLLIRWRTGIGAKMWHLRIDAPKVEAKPRPKRNVVQVAIEFADCLQCSTPFVSQRGAKYCGAQCRTQSQRDYMRNRYRKQVGIPLDAPKYARAG